MAIDLKECLNTIECGSWFENLHVFTADVNKGTGGKLLIIPKARIARKNNPVQRIADKAAASKPANHGENFTRNIELPNRSIITIHPILITQINNHSLV